MDLLYKAGLVLCFFMDHEELRPLALEYLSKNPTTQVLNILNGVEHLAQQKGYYKDSPAWSYGVTEHRMPREDREKVREIVNEFLIEGLLGWGINESNPNPPHLKVTSYGEVCIKEGMPQPYDPDGYLRYLKNEIPNIDDTIFMYMTESLQAYLRGLMLSSTVMLGGASEKTFLLLKESFIAAIADQKRREEVEKKFNTARGVKQQFDIFRQYIEQIRKTLPKNLSDDLSIQLDGIFNFIRNCRNDVGHPTGRIIDRSLAFNNLRLFMPYCKRSYELMAHFQTNNVQL